MVSETAPGDQGPPCPECHSDLTERRVGGVECRDCGHEWVPERPAVDGGESVVRAVRERRDTPLNRAESNIKQEIETALDTGMASGVGIAALFGSLGYLIALNTAVSQGYVDQAIFLDPNVGVVTAGIVAGAGALILGYNMGWQAGPEVDD